MPRITSFKDSEYLMPYVALVESGKVEICREQGQLLDLLGGIFAREEVYEDTERMAKYMTYQKYFPFDLFPWEMFIFDLHNCMFTPEGFPRWQDLFMLLGRGAGKNGYMSFEDFCWLTPTNGIREYDVDIVANSEDQAKTSFDEVYNVVTNPAFKKQMEHNFKWNLTEIVNRHTRAKLRFRTSNPKTKDGGKQGAINFDEIHAYENWDSLNVFITGLGKKPHPRITYASTDGDVREGPLDQLKERAAKILSGELDDNGLLPFICKLDDAEEVHDEKNWHKANPSLQYRPDLLRQIRTEYQNYILEPVKNASFMTKRMNLPQGHADTEVTSWDNILKTNRPLPDLIGKPCVCGVDFSKTTDFMSAVLLFRDGNQYYAKHHSWFCDQSKDKGRIKIPLDEMERRGLLTIVHDVEINPFLVTEWIQDMMQLYRIEAVAADSYRFAIFRRALQAIGFDPKVKNVKLVRPSDVMFAQNKINSMFAHGGIIWGDDPLMRWYTNNTKLEPAANGNFKYAKIEGKSRKTDGFMAFVHAMTVEDAIPEQTEVQFAAPLVF